MGAFEDAINLIRHAVYGEEVREGIASALELSMNTQQSVAGKEDSSNKVTTVNSNSTDIEYPSAKAVYDSLDNKESKSNKIETSINPSSASTTRYPSELAVVSYVSSSILQMANEKLSFDYQTTSISYSATNYKKVFTNAAIDTNIKGIVFTHPNSLDQVALCSDGTIRTRSPENNSYGSWEIVSEKVSNKVTTVNSNSTDIEYPSAKAVYNFVRTISQSNIKYDASTTTYDPSTREGVNTIYTRVAIESGVTGVTILGNSGTEFALCSDGTIRYRTPTGSSSYTGWINPIQKATSIGESNKTSGAYPTVRAVYNFVTAFVESAISGKANTADVNTALDGKEDLSNKVPNRAAMDNLNSETQYPSIKTMVQYTDEKASDVLGKVSEEVGDLKSALNGTVNLIGDATIYNVSLAESGTGVGANWNSYYDISLPKGTKLNFYLSAYTGVLFTDVSVRFYDTTNTLRSLAPSVMQTGKLQTYTLFEDCNRIWVQINRSAPENGVSAQFIMSFDTSGLSADVAKIQSVLPTNTQEVLKSNIQKYDGKRFGYNGVEEDTGSGWITSDYLPVGLGITVTGYSYSSTRPGIVEYNASKQTLGVVAGNGEYVTRTYTPPTKVAYVRLQTLASKQDTKATSIINSEPKVYRVEKNGSGDFTKLVDAINEAVRYMDSVVYVGAGTWDIIDELGSEYVESVSITQRGLYLKNRVRVICSSNSLITCNYTGSRADTISWLSAFNAGPLGFTLENATIESSNCRYAIHDERDQDADEYNNYYINCKIKHDNTDGGYNQCIGGGLGLNGHVIIDGCIFENPARTNYQIVYYHNSAGSGKSFVEVKGSYFKGTNTLGFQWYGSSPATQKSTLFAHDNSLGSAIQHTGASGATVENTEIVSFNNEIRP